MISGFGLLEELIGLASVWLGEMGKKDANRQLGIHVSGSIVVEGSDIRSTLGRAAGLGGRFDPGPGLFTEYSALGQKIIPRKAAGDGIWISCAMGKIQSRYFITDTGERDTA